jgi:thiamine biosynthesis lipoprotein
MSFAVSAGGHVMALGRPGGRPWAVGLRGPRGGGLLARLELEDGEVVSTSGDYERFLSCGGRRYSHVIDPRTGQPASDAMAASVVAAAAPDAGAASDAASSALFVAGASRWRDAAQRMATAQALLVDQSGRVHVSAAMRRRLALREAVELCPGL